VARQIGRHDLRAGRIQLPLLDQIGKRLINKRLELPTSRLRTWVRISEFTRVANLLRTWIAKSHRHSLIWVLDDLS
jgi:hypothetical protein